jgi:protein O-mannosyl-transferase
LLIEKLPMLALGIVAAALAASAQTGALAAKTLAEWSISERTAQAAYGLVFYVWKSVAPTGLSPLYELPDDVSPGAMPYAACLVAVGVAIVAVLVLARRLPALAVASAWYVVLLAPVLGVFQSGEQLVADRYSHLATVGFAVTFAGVGLALSQRAKGTLSPAWVVALPALVVFALSALTFAQASVWRTTLSLWTHAASVTPTPLVRFALAEELSFQGRRDEARAQLEFVAAGGGRTGGRAWYILGEEFKGEGRFADAADAYARAAPLMEQAFMAHVQLGALYLGPLVRPDDAVAQFRLAVADVERGGRRPVSGLPFLALGDALRRVGDAPGAHAAFTRALEFPDSRPDAERELRGLK